MDEANSVSELFTAYRYWVGLGVPLAIVVIGVVGKKIARGPNWARTDFYVGSELSLAGVSGALVNFADLLKSDKVMNLLWKKLIGGNVAIAVFGLICFYIALSFHQDYGAHSPTTSNKKQLFFLLGVSNVIGLATLVGALLLMPP
jgi:hypothetical protein